MKKILYFFIFVLIVSVVGCGKKDTTAEHKKNLAKAGFFESEKVINSDSPFEEWNICVSAKNSSVFKLAKADDGWVYYPCLEEDKGILYKAFNNPPYMKIITLSQTETPSVIVKTDNSTCAEYRSWNLIKTDSSGAGYYIFYKTSADSWGAYPNGYVEPGYISNVSMSSLKEGAQEYFESDPFGRKPSDAYSAIYAEFWDFDKGGMLEVQ